MEGQVRILPGEQVNVVKIYKYRQFPIWVYYFDMNKNNIVIGLLVIAVILLAFIAFKPKDENITASELQNEVTQNTQIPTTPVSTNNTQQTPSTAQTQKMYRDSQLGFSFQYPSTWKTPTTTSNGNIVEVYANEAISTPFIAHYTSGMTLNDFISTAYGHSTNDTPQQITVSGQKGYKYTYETSATGRGTPLPLFNQQVAFEDGKGGLYVINYAVSPANKTQGITLFNQIISSFKL